MVTFYIQPGTDAWYVLRNGQPTSRHCGAHQALIMALLLARRSRERGEAADFAGIVTEVMDDLDSANDAPRRPKPYRPPRRRGHARERRMRVRPSSAVYGPEKLHRPSNAKPFSDSTQRSKRSAHSGWGRVDALGARVEMHLEPFSGPLFPEPRFPPTKRRARHKPCPPPT